MIRVGMVSSVRVLLSLPIHWKVARGNISNMGPIQIHKKTSEIYIILFNVLVTTLIFIL